MTRSHLTNARTPRKGQHLESGTLETQPNHHFPTVFLVAVLWFSCDKTIYEITSSSLEVRVFLNQVDTGAEPGANFHCLLCSATKRRMAGLRPAFLSSSCWSSRSLRQRTY